MYGNSSPLRTGTRGRRCTSAKAGWRSPADRWSTTRSRNDRAGTCRCRRDRASRPYPDHALL